MIWYRQRESMCPDYFYILAPPDPPSSLLFYYGFQMCLHNGPCLPGLFACGDLEIVTLTGIWPCEVSGAPPSGPWTASHWGAGCRMALAIYSDVRDTVLASVKWRCGRYGPPLTVSLDRGVNIIVYCNQNLSENGSLQITSMSGFSTFVRLPDPTLGGECQTFYGAFEDMWYPLSCHLTPPRLVVSRGFDYTDVPSLQCLSRICAGELRVVSASDSDVSILPASLTRVTWTYIHQRYVPLRIVDIVN